MTLKVPKSPSLTVFYDEGCGPCTRVANLLDRLNWLNAIWFRPAAEYPDGTGDEYHDIHSVRGDGRVFLGFATYQQIAWRIPLLWLVAPIMYFPPVTWLGRKAYRRIADSRGCEVEAPPS
jgi:predicted DCC family thiol-disulfide oxidoreductase YuxK